jgi:hypothetical protein
LAPGRRSEEAAVAVRCSCSRLAAYHATLTCAQAGGGGRAGSPRRRRQGLPDARRVHSGGAGHL